ncbi:GDSL-type esterase/lipase family protein [Clostridium sp.]|uniref:GDSL-type esterase/lipase family protein n=1 Tax=Clostridium sp. TaxID=1506 RepID=UPI002907A89D|nr:GDSL-type esterase/lipase family protein [Clostridium sp.]MDU3410691.1 hypothetical protein [Clostridium sp.]
MGNILTEVILTAKEELDQTLNKASNVIPQLISDIDKKLEETKELVDGAGAASKQEVEEVKSSLEENKTQTKNDIENLNINKAEKTEVTKTINELKDSNDLIYAKKSEVTNCITPKGNSIYAELPKLNNNVGDYYYCNDGDGSNGAGNYVWNGTTWYFGGTGDEGYSILKEDIDDLSTTLFDVEKASENKCNPDTVIHGRLIEDGTVDAGNTQSDTSDFIKIPDGMTYVVVSYKGIDTISYHRICFYDNGGMLVKYVSSGNTAFQIPKGAKLVRVSNVVGQLIYCGFSVNENYTGFVDYKPEIKTIKNNVLPSEILNNIIDYPLLFNKRFNATITGYISAPSGNEIIDPKTKRTNFVTLDGYNKIHYTDSMGSLGYAVAYYDENITLLPDISIKGTGVGTEVRFTDIPPSAKYAIYSEYGKDDGGSFILFNTNNIESKIQDLVIKSSSIGISSFLKFGVVGDSLSVGHTTNPYTGNAVGRNIKYSWGQYLARRNGNVCLNFGVTGMTAKTWMSNAQCHDLLIKSENKCQCYVLALGANDAEKLNTVPLGEISDINFSDMSQNADTFYGWYAKVINTINITNNKAPIFVFTVPYPRSENADVKLINTAIREMSSDSRFNNLHLVDLALEYDDYYKGELIYGESVDAHYTAKGYNAISMVNELAISDYMNKNPNPFRGIPFIEYGENDVIN